MSVVIKKIAIVKLPGANVSSVDYWLKRNGCVTVVVDNDRRDVECDAVVVPGVGHFDNCMKYIRKSGLDDFIFSKHASGVIIIGICLGMQVMFGSSDEGGERGLGLLPGHIEKLQSGDMPTPNIGWRNITKPNCISRTSDTKKVFFMHGYAVKDHCAKLFNGEGAGYWLSQCNENFVAGFWRNNLVGFQFHPEKSYIAGDDLLLEVLSGQKSYC